MKDTGKKGFAPCALETVCFSARDVIETSGDAFFGEWDDLTPREDTTSISDIY